MKIYRLFFIILLICNLTQLHTYAQVNTLDYFIGQGLKHSPVLNDINNQVSSGSIDSLLVKAGKKPQVSYNGLLFYAPVVNGIGYSEVITNVSNITSVVYASQNIFNQKTIEAQYSKINIRNEGLRNVSEITENDLKKVITMQYLSVCLVSNDIKFNIDLLESSKDEEIILRKLVDNGFYKQVDYLLFMVELMNQELLLSELKIQFQKEVAALNLLCGLPDSTSDQFVLPDITIRNPVSISNSPLLTRFVLDSMRIQNEKLLVDRNYKPSVKWFSDAGLVNNMPRDIYKNFGLSVGLSLTVPIYDGQQKKLNYDRLKIAENTRSNYEDYFSQQFSIQQQQLYSELRKTQENMSLVNQQVEFAEAVIKQEKYLLNTGNISITDYVSALKNYISVKRNLNQYQVKILNIITEINYWNQ
jgi:outer membrane protein TolC